MIFADERQAKEKGRQSFLKGLGELEGDISIVRTKVKRLIVDFGKAQENASVELSTSLNRGVESHRSVLCTLHKASSTALLEPLRNLDRLCPNTSGSLKSLSIAQNNINSTLSILSPFVNLENTLNKLKQDMQNEDQLAYVINQCVKLADHKSRILAKADPSSAETLGKLFKPLDDFDGFVNSHIWKTIENAMEITKKDPSSLGKIVRIIEKIEKNPEEKVKVNLEQGIIKRLEWLLGTDKLNELAENTHTAISELKYMLSKVVPCFPEKYDLKPFCIEKYRERIEAAIDPHLSNLEKIRESPGLLVLIFQWINEYGSLIKELCPNAMEEYAIQMLFAKVKKLMPDFLTHMENLLSDWINRALNAHISSQEIRELSKGNEALKDTFPEEMFSAINKQLEFISNRLNGEVLIEVFRVCANRLLSQQSKQMSQIEAIIDNGDPEVQVPSFCLSINNNQRSSKHCLDLQKFCQSKFPEPFFQERIDNLFTPVNKGFLNLCLEGTNYMAMSIMISISNETVAQLFTKQWQSTRPVLLAFTTVEDYDADISKWLVSDFYVRKFRKRFFEIFIQAYLERIVMVFKDLNPCNYEPVILPFIMVTPDSNLNKKELALLLNNHFRDLVSRDKYECMEFSNKFEIGFNCDAFFTSLIRIREGGELDTIESLIKGFVANSKILVSALATVLNGKKS